ncbi:hypothetical protein SVIOM342S_07795 [Streptomyces violaceorubidus]
MSALRAVPDSRTGAPGSAVGAVLSAAALPAVRPVVSIAPAATAVARARVVRLRRARNVLAVTTCSSFGVPSSWRPPTTVSYARTGVPFAAQITLRGARSASGRSAPAAFAADTACDSAFAAEIFGVTVAGLIAFAVAFTTCSVFPASLATTRSPPRTGRPS